MEPVIAVAAAAASLVSLYFVWRQVAEMKRQTDLQREIAESAGQPYVWADVRIQVVNGWMLEFVVGNSGSTVATEVKVHVDPPFPDTDERTTQYVAQMHQKLEGGISSLPPGRMISWTIGDSPGLVNREGNTAHHIRIECNGPFGPVPVSEYVINFSDFRESVARHTGSLRDVAKAIDKATARIPDLRGAIRVTLESAEPNVAEE